MAVTVTHATQATGTDAGNGEIAKAEWNEAHTFTLAASRLLGRHTGSDGAAEEISLGTGLSFAGGALTLDADLQTWAGVTPSANGQSLVSAANYAAMRALLDVEAGTDFYSIAAADAAIAAVIESEAYSSAWNGDTTHAPSRNDVYDQFETYFPQAPSGNVCLAQAVNAGAGGTTSTSVADTIIYVPYWNLHRRIISGIGGRISTGVASSNLQIAIYANSGFQPSGAALAETGNVDAASAATFIAPWSGSDITLEAQTWYWIAWWWSHSNGRLSGNQSIGIGSGFYGHTSVGNLIQSGNSTGFHYESAEAYAASFPNASSETLSLVTTATRIWEPFTLFDIA